MVDLLFGFQGRANRAKWWLVALAIFVVEMIVLSLIVGTARHCQAIRQIRWRPAMGSDRGIVIHRGVLATWIHLAIAVKRYHDRNKSGWWVLIIFVPVIGGLWYFIECGFLRGTPGPNTYGPDPLAAA